MPIAGPPEVPTAALPNATDRLLATGLRSGLIGRLLQARELLRYLIRTARWSAVIGAAAVAPFVVRWVGGSNPSPTERIAGLRVGAIVLAIGSGFLLDDTTEETTAHLPTPISWRRVLRLALATPVLATLWGLLVVTAPEPLGPNVEVLPLGALSVEFSAMAVAALAISAAATRIVPDGLGGGAAAPLLMIAFVALALLPDKLTLFVGQPLDPRWSSTHRIWWLILSGGVLFLLAFSADRGRPGLMVGVRGGGFRKRGGSRSPG